MRTCIGVGFCLCFLVTTIASAEIVKLKSGRVIDAESIERGQGVISVDMGAGEIVEFPNEEIKYIKGEGLDSASLEYYDLLMDAMNEPDTSMEGWAPVGSITFSVADAGPEQAFSDGVAYGSQGMWDEAIASLTKAIEGKFRLPDAFFHRANACYNKGQFQQAIDDYSEAIKLAPESALVYGNRAESYRKIGQLDMAMADFKKALELNPEDSLAWANKALTNYNLGNLDQAIADLSKAVDLDPSNAMYYANRGQFYVMGEHYEQALADLEQAKVLGWQDPGNVCGQIKAMMDNN